MQSTSKAELERLQLQEKINELHERTGEALIEMQREQLNSLTQLLRQGTEQDLK